MVKSAYPAILVLEAIAGQFPEDVRRAVFLKVTPEQETFEFDSETGEIIR